MTADTTSGPNEHHIPRFWQRGFAVPRGGKKPNAIWVFTRNGEAACASISGTASEDHFYGSALDAKLKVPENALGAQVALLRKQPVGATVDPGFAAELIGHLAPRAGHLRATMATGLKRVATAAKHLFTDPESLTAMLGLDQDAPNPQFLRKASDALANHAEIQALGMPQPILERMAFYIAREQIEINAGESAALFDALLGRWSTEAPQVARDGHNRALEKLAEGQNPRGDLLASFSWTIEDAPPEGAMLPDCIAIAFAPGQPPLPLMLLGKEIEAVVVPLSTSKLLLGRTPGTTRDLSDINADAAACSEVFFLGAEDHPAFRALQGRIGSHAAAFFEAALSEGIADLLPPPASNQTAERHEVADLKTDTGFSYTVMCRDFGDEPLNRRLAAVLEPLVARLSALLPLERLDGVSFAADYSRSVRAIEAGEDPPLYTTDTVEDAGLAGCAALVVREGVAKGHIVLSALVADYLLSDDGAANALGLQTIVHQIGLVAQFELVERAVPGALLTNVITDPFQAGLHAQVGHGVNGYIAARLAGTFGDGEQRANFYRAALVESLGHLAECAEGERASLPLHRDVDRLTGALMMPLQRVLTATGLFLGHCEGSWQHLLDGGGQLRAALDRLGLSYWLADFGKDLDRHWQRLGQWGGIDGFLAFNRHVERLLWAVGVYPWESSEGLRVEVRLPPGVVVTETAESPPEL